jgi:hypothetical protein
MLGFTLSMVAATILGLASVLTAYHRPESRLGPALSFAWVLALIVAFGLIIGS